MTFILRSPVWLKLCFLALIVVAANAPIVPNGLALHDSDSLISPLAAEYFFRNHTWTAFPFSIPYGGTVFTSLRAVLASLFETFSARPDAGVFATLIFSFILAPVAIAWSSYFMIRKHFSESSALAVGVFSAIGFHLWMTMAGMDFYTPLLVFGSMLLGLRGRMENPWREMNLKQLFGVAVFCGILSFIFRASLMYAAVFFIPWRELTPTFRRFVSPEGRIEKILRNLSLFLFGLFLYLVYFGTELGTVGQKRVVLNAGPNFIFGVYTLLIFVFWIYRKSIRKMDFERGVIFLSGFLIGMTPEILNWMHVGTVHRSWDASAPVQTWAQLVLSLKEIFVGLAKNTTYRGLIQNSLIVLFCMGVWALYGLAKKRPILWLFFGIFVFNIVAYMKIYMTSPGATRYLFPIYPFVLACYAAAWDKWVSGGTDWKKPFVVALFILGIGTLLIQRYYWNLPAADRNREIYEVVDYFRTHQIADVLTDDYEQSLQYTMAAKTLTTYTAGHYPICPIDALEKVEKTDRAGFLYSRTTAPEKNTAFNAAGKKWFVNETNKVGNLILVIAKSAN